MIRILITFLMLLATAAPAVALPITFEFKFSGLVYTNDAVVQGYITFESDYIINPCNNIFYLEPTDGQPDGLLAVTRLEVAVTGTSGGLGDGTFHLTDFSKVIFDTSPLALDLNVELVGQPTDSLNGKLWGEPDVAPDSDPPISLSGDFEIFAKSGNNAPSGISPFQIGTSNTNGDGLQIVSFKPASGAVPEPSTFILLITGILGVAGLARRRAMREE